MMRLQSCFPRSRDARQRCQNSELKGARLKFYTVYDRVTKKYDKEFAEVSQADLSDVLIFVRSSVFFLPNRVVAHRVD